MIETAAEIPMTCAEIAERGLIERYVAGTIGADEAAALEAHYLTCAHCQAELRLATAIRQALAQGQSARPSRRAAWMWGAGLALAAGLAALLFFRPGARTGKWRDLAAVTDAPGYLGVEVRGAPVRGDSLFSAAMTDYHEHRYAAAAAGLQAALSAGADSVVGQFFLGSALLMEDRAEAAAEAYARVIGSGESPYLAEAHLYRAKALLQLARPAEALTELGAVNARSEPLNAWTRALADSIGSRLPR